MGRERILVLGAGLAGLAAAEKLLDAGLSVTVVDSFPLPGGRVASFQAPCSVAGLAPGQVVEHGLHAFFQHYHGLYGLMDRAGLAKPPFVGGGIYLWNAAQGHYQVEGGPLFWLLRALDLSEQIRGPKGHALSALGRLTGALSGALKNPEQTDELTAIAWLRQFSVPEQAIEHVFRPCMYSLTSLSLERLSALEMMRWMSNILPDPRMRGLQGGGSQALCMPIADGLARRGADIRLGVEVTGLGLDLSGRPTVGLIEAPDRTGLRHVLVEGFVPAPVPDTAGFDAVICTLPWERLVALAQPSLRRAASDVFDNFQHFRNVHPLTVRLWFERPLHGVEERYILSAGTVFDVLRPTAESGQQGIVLVDALVEDIDSTLPELGYAGENYVTPGPRQDAVVGRVLQDLEKLYPGQIEGNPVTSKFIHTREGIIASEPNMWRRRPPAYIGLPNFVLAGDYTQQPYGVCMEGATRSGQIAAKALIEGGPVKVRRAAFGQVAYSAYSLFVRR